jgi:hypothetical protein
MMMPKTTKTTKRNNVSALRRDPTRTITLRKAFIRDLEKRFRKVKQSIWLSVYVQDCFGLKEDTNLLVNAPLPKHVFAFDTNDKKVNGFMKWLQDEMDRDILGKDVGTWKGIGNDRFSDTYITSSYKAGMKRAKSELKKGGYDVTKDGTVFSEMPSVKRNWISAAFNMPIHASKVQAIYTRTYENLQGITNKMSEVIRASLSESLAEGRDPYQTARILMSRLDKKGMGLEAKFKTKGGYRNVDGLTRARTLARTEMIRAHHVGNIAVMEEAKVMDIVIKAEWSTAGDEAVCDLCWPLEKTIWPLSEAKNMIPRHPNCRCVAIPAVGKNKKGAKSLDPAIRKSLSAEGGLSSWAGQVGLKPLTKVRRTAKNPHAPSVSNPSPSAPLKKPNNLATPPIQEWKQGNFTFQHEPLNGKHFASLKEFASDIDDGAVGGWYGIQHFLRNRTLIPKYAGNDDALRATKLYVRNLKNTIGRSTMTNPSRKVYRGYSNAEELFGVPLEELKIGMTGTEKGFCSVTGSKKIAKELYMQKNLQTDQPILLKIYTGKKMEAFPMNRFQDMGKAEILLKPGMKFEITNITSNNEITVKIVSKVSKKAPKPPIGKPKPPAPKPKPKPKPKPPKEPKPPKVKEPKVTSGIEPTKEIWDDEKKFKAYARKIEKLFGIKVKKQYHSEYGTGTYKVKWPAQTSSVSLERAQLKIMLEELDRYYAQLPDTRKPTAYNLVTRKSPASKNDTFAYLENGKGSGNVYGAHWALDKTINLAEGLPLRSSGKVNLTVGWKNHFKVHDGTSLGGTFNHEFGHAVHHKIMLYDFDAYNKWERMYKGMKKGGNTMSINISGYASKNSSEMFAESFAAFVHPNYGKKKVFKNFMGEEETVTMKLPKKVHDFFVEHVFGGEDAVKAIRRG